MKVNIDPREKQLEAVTGNPPPLLTVNVKSISGSPCSAKSARNARSSDLHSEYETNRTSDIVAPALNYVVYPIT